MQNGIIGFGLVGTGMAGGFQAKELAFVDGAQLVAVCSRNEENVRRFADEYGVQRWATDYRDLLESDAVDVVCVLTPTGSHREIVIAASEAGKHVLVEKPLETTLAKADEMIRVCRENGTKLGVIFQMRFGSVGAKLTKLVASGAMGKIHLADAIDKSSRTAAYYATAAWRGTWELEGGGCLMTQSIHIVDLLQWIVGPVKSVTGRVATKRHAIQVEDTAAALVSFANGAMGVIESTTSVRPALKSRLEIHGENGSVVANAQYDKILLWDVKDYPQEDVEPPSPLTDIDDPWAYPQTRHRVQLQDMTDAVREDRDPMLTGEDARVSLAIVSAIYESSRTGREIFLETLKPESL